MTIDKIIVLLISGFGILLTYWFFLMKKDKEVSVKESADIIVEGGYTPSTVVLPFGKTTKLNFVRRDSNSCLEEVVLGDFNIRRYLPLNEKITIELTPEKKGEFKYSCGMNMFHGKIIVK